MPEYVVEAEELYKVRTVRQIEAENEEEARMKVGAFNDGDLKRQFDLRPLAVYKVGQAFEAYGIDGLKVLDGKMSSLT